MRKRLADRMHGSCGDACGIERRDPRVARPRQQNRTHQSHERIEMLHARRVGHETGVVAPFRMAQHVGDPLPVRLVGSADVDPAVARAECLVGRGQQMRRSGRTRRTTEGKITRGMPVRLLERGFHQRGVDNLPAARFLLVRVRSEDADRGQETGIDVGDRIAGLDRRPAGLDRHGHQAREALLDQF